MQSNSYKTNWFGNIFRLLLLGLARFVFSLRYKVKLTGLDKLEGTVEKALILPNHPAYSDPCLVYTYLWPKLRMRPMTSANILNNPALGWLKWLTKSVVVPQMDVQSQDARTRAQAALDLTIEGLREGTNHLVYPAGRLYKWDHEHLGSVKGLTEILKAVPEARVIRIRTKGMWGSSLSYAYTGQKPKLVKMMLRGGFLFLANLLFFMPRREISIEIEEVDRKDLPELRRELINPYFENWYNEGGPETPVYVPYHFLFGPRNYEFPPIKCGVDIHPRDVKRAIQGRVNALVEEQIGRPLADDERKPSTRLENIGLDSLERMELSLEIEQQFQTGGGTQVPNTLLEAWALAAGLLGDDGVNKVPTKWTGDFREEQVWSESLPPAETLPKCLFLRATGAMTGSAAAVADSLSGMLSYKRLFLGAYLLSKRLKKLPGTHIGLLLPASVAADVAFFAILLACKIPVNLNWTTGPANLQHALKSCNVSSVVTSKKFVDRTGVTIPTASKASPVFLEDLRSSIGTIEKIWAAAWLAFLPFSYAKLVDQASSDDVGVVLFTSGSEKAPKCVPLTHKNILAAARSGVQAFEITNKDTILAFLPVFHVFGLVVTLMGITGGVRVVHDPDPTAGGALSRKIRDYGVTIVPATPTFLNSIIERSQPGALDSLRLAVVGAEKCPKAVFQKFREKAPKNALILEGYGITECSAVVAANTPSEYMEGTLGKPLPGVSMRIVDQNSMKPIGPGESGMILIAGDIVFGGYGNTDEDPFEDPFIEIDNKRWYKSGDIARIDEEGFIHFEGRLKRFVKIGGEMVSLPAMEEPLVQAYPPTDEGPQVAVEGIETEEGVTIALFTSVPDLDLAKANSLLAEYGLKGIVRLHEIQFLPDGLPTLGTGKTDYKILKARLS